MREDAIGSASLLEPGRLHVLPFLPLPFFLLLSFTNAGQSAPFTVWSFFSMNAFPDSNW